MSAADTFRIQYARQSAAFWRALQTKHAEVRVAADRTAAKWDAVTDWQTYRTAERSERATQAIRRSFRLE